MSEAYQSPPAPGGGGSSFLDWQLDHHAETDRRLLELRADRDEDGRPVIRVTGEVDLVTAPDLRAAVEECLAGGACDVVLDLRQLSFIDSTGLAVLVSATKRLAERGGSLTLAGPGEVVRRALEVTGLDRYVPVELHDGDGLDGDGPDGDGHAR